MRDDTSKVQYYNLMKKVFSLLLFLAMQTVLFAQEREYVPFVEEGKSWYLGYFHSDGTYPITPEDPAGEGIDCIFTMQGDTEINGKTYKNVYCQFKEYYGDEDLHYYCAVREEDYRVYIVEEEATEEKLIYDFSNPEEIVALPFTFNDDNFVRTRGGHDSDFLPGQLMYSVYTSSGDEIDYSHDVGIWIEGVGDYIHNPFAFEFSSLIYDKPKLGKNMWVHSCMKDGKHIFNINWTAEISAIEERMYIDNSPKDSPLYDLQGRRLTSQPSKGVFIKDGKKVVVR